MAQMNRDHSNMPIAYSYLCRRYAIGLGVLCLALAITAWSSQVTGLLIRNLVALQVSREIDIGGMEIPTAQREVARIDSLRSTVQSTTGWVLTDSNWETRRLLGELHLRNGRLMMAAEMLNVDIAYCPEWLSCLRQGYVYLAMDRIDEAVQLWRQFPGADIYFALQGDSLYERGQTAEANYLYEISWRIAATPTSHKQTMFLNLCRQERAARALSEAIAWCQEAVAAVRSIWTLTELGRTYYEAGDYSEAIVTLDEVIRIKPDLAAAYQWLGLSLWKIGQRGAGLDALNHAIRLAPNSVWLRLDLANVYAIQKEYDKARCHYQVALDLTERVSLYEEIKRRLADLPAETDAKVLCDK